MPRQAEVVTIKSLHLLLNASTNAFDKAEQVRKVAEQTASIPDAHKMLMESAQGHEAEGLKDLRKIAMRITDKLAEAVSTRDGAARLIELAESMKLFPKGEEPKAETAAATEAPAETPANPAATDSTPRRRNR